MKLENLIVIAKVSETDLICSNPDMDSDFKLILEAKTGNWHWAEQYPQ